MPEQSGGNQPCKSPHPIRPALSAVPVSCCCWPDRNRELKSAPNCCGLKSGTKPGLSQGMGPLLRVSVRILMFDWLCQPCYTCHSLCHFCEQGSWPRAAGAWGSSTFEGKKLMLCHFSHAQHCLLKLLMRVLTIVRRLVVFQCPWDLQNCHILICVCVQQHPLTDLNPRPNM